ncbi:prepilin-type N-terminal cleavage/methylation domain-containing protein [bacterium]|nr:prepilin-type N-terminal cleavage/methylation domain-containing protein [bacterium]
MKVLGIENTLINIKREGFTLAEVLITLGIVGVVAALTLPAVINNIKHKNLETAFKKEYSTLAQAVHSVYLTELSGEFPSDVLAFFDLLQTRYIKSVACNNTRNNCPTDVFPIRNFGSTASMQFIVSNYKNYNGTSAASGYCNDGIIAANDGSFIFLDISSQNEDSAGMIFLCVDTNGWRKAPNRIGHDFFMFQLGLNGKLLPMGADGTYFTNCSRSDSSDNGLGCTVKALSDKDYFKNLP